ncbi:MAG: N-acetyl-gamma-glutamyl-phosphate reductase [Gammaproteobacteria bacterium]|nr:N-acetyl-gamma-glutamyl-phosphate reductase [Gammaproteobacteria bacterium]NNF48737.1 N-acetyl-gamma-glutamyl-phosphate reductase [Woeseiaceae bacterium]MBT8094582.1 N-acetyl-gamma-glutamyl-phosphate reductase [Gammaproteobacteria bacterium]MBT8106347.1 N-acetyl-gamma-glutamyl-phosphate reductase [Gammaproteobacteria bacterium]NNK26362.1 N-acetyl-gamma-glutamyl-phosphate reductase [Woeseiaceae bacterium]
MSRAIPAVILGASGYVGGELLRLVAVHPDFELRAAVSDSAAGQTVGALFGHLAAALPDHEFVAHADWLGLIEPGSELALFSAAPHGASAAMLADALAACAQKSVDVHVVDASADFRFAEQAAWESIYGTTHGAPGLLGEFTCALPEHADEIDTPHVGHPGCFATASTLATVPLIASGLTGPEVFIAGITGSTGSGKKPVAGTHHPERNSNLYAYKPLAHRHAPEVATLTEAASGRTTGVHFVPHSGPFARGIHVTVQAKSTSVVSASQLRAVYEDAYAGAPFVHIVDGTPRIKNVVASNHCHIGVATDGDSIVVMAAIDNLVKGAAGGAMQWMNRLWRLPETTGLDMPAPGWT